jgi:hypothetical protein
MPGRIITRAFAFVIRDGGEYRIEYIVGAQLGQAFGDATNALGGRPAHGGRRMRH